MSKAPPATRENHDTFCTTEVWALVFWNCVNNAVLPNRGVIVAPQGPVPLFLLRELIDRIGISPEEASTLTVQEAEKRVARHWLDATDPG